MPFRVALPALIVLTLSQALAFALPPDPIKQARAMMREKKFAEAAKSIESYLATNRFDGRSWTAYSVALHNAKQYERAIEAAKKAIELGLAPETQMYDISCGYALLGKKDEAILWLRKALDAGFCDQETLEKDTDIDGLRTDPRFVELTGLNAPPEKSVEKQWAWDLDFLVRRMEQMHWRLYANVSKETFRTEIEKLKADAPKLSFERVKARLTRILAMVGDGHTMLRTLAEGETTLQRIPLHFNLFPDGLYVIGTLEAQRDLLGAKVLKIGPLATQTVLEKLHPYCSVDNEMTFLMQAPLRLLIWPAVLQEIGAATGDDVTYDLRLPDGSVRTATLSPVPTTRGSLGHAFFRPGLVYANASSKTPLPLYLEKLDKPLTLESLDEHKAVYFGFHQVAENQGQSFAAFVDSLTKRLKEKSAEYLIIDMRLNGGGNTGLVLPLIHALIRDDRVNCPGHLFVIIGRNTFSAAQNTVNLLELHTHATFVGEPTGSRPNFVGESTHIVMPYSKLRVYCSSRYWQHVVSTDHRTWVAPQIAAELSFQDFADNRDPCLDAILQRIKGTKQAADQK